MFGDMQTLGGMAWCHVTRDLTVTREGRHVSPITAVGDSLCWAMAQYLLGKQRAVG